MAITYLSGQRLQGTSADRGATTLSDTEWVIRCKYDIITATSGGNGQLYFGFTDQPNSTSIIASRDGLGIVLRSGGDINLGYATDQAWQIDAFAVAASVVTYYIEFKRTSATNFTVTIYSNSGFSTLVEAESHTITSSISGLKYMSIGGWDNGASGEMKARISEVQIWNDTTSTSGTPVDFDLSTSSGWTFTGSACSISTGSEYIEGSSITNDDRGAKELPALTSFNLPLQSTFEETDTRKQYSLLYPSGTTGDKTWIEMGTAGALTRTYGYTLLWSQTSTSLDTGINGDCGTYSAGIGEYFETGLTAVIGKKVNKIVVPLKKDGTLSGDFHCYVVKANGDLIELFPEGESSAMSADDLTTSYVDYTFINNDNEYVMANDDGVGFRYDSTTNAVQMGLYTSSGSNTGFIYICPVSATAWAQHSGYQLKITGIYEAY